MKLFPGEPGQTILMHVFLLRAMFSSNYFIDKIWFPWVLLALTVGNKVLSGNILKEFYF
jgi:hypothetical protein